MILLLLVTLSLDTAEISRLAAEAAEKVQAGKLVEARSALERAAYLAPQNAAIAFNLGQICEASGDKIAAVAAFERYLELARNAPDVAEVRARITRLKQSAPAIPESARHQVMKGQSYFKMERFAEAEAAFRQAATEAPSWGAPWFNLGVLCEQQQRWGDALAAYRSYAPLAPPEEIDTIKAKIVELEIKRDDQVRAQAEAEAKRQQAEAEAEAQRIAAERAAEQQRIADAEAAVRRVAQAKEDAYRNKLQRRVVGFALLGVGVGFGVGAAAFAGLGAQSSKRIQEGGFANLSDLEAEYSRGRRYNTPAAGLTFGFALFSTIGTVLAASTAGAKKP